MPIFIAQILRFIVIAVVQSAVFTALLALLDPLVDKAKTAVKNTFGLSDDDAGTYVANFIIDTIELAGLTVASLKTRFPLKVADKLGLTARGWTRGALPARVSTGAKAPAAAAASAKAAGTPSSDVIAQGVAAARGSAVAKVVEVGQVLTGFIGVPVGLGLLLTNTIDFAAWNSSAYQGSFQKVFAVFGLKPDESAVKANTVSDDVWNRVYSTYKALGAYAINDPYKQQSVIFSKQALIDLVNKVGAELNAQTGSAPAKAVLGITHALVLTAAQSPGIVSSSAPSVVSGTSAFGTSVPSIKVFTGIVSQGVLGQGLVFNARPDDLIESVQDLQDAASNNLAATLTALPASLSYEIKIVSTVVTKEGFTQRGQAQQVISGYSADGKPKYKTVVSKFATLIIYLINEKGTRTKVRTIVLGPTNVLKFNPTTTQISGIESVVKSDLSTGNIGDISSVVTNVPVSEPAASTSTELVRNEDANGNITYSRVTTTNPKPSAAAEPNNAALVPTVASSATTSASAPTQAIQRPGANAQTLSEWYAANGQSLPSVSNRSTLYQALGLGQASMYTGTAEQNTKLLNALKL